MAQPEEKPERYTGETLPAWSLPAAASAEIGIGVEWPERVTRDWALGGSTGAGIRVCILDSGVQPDHPLVGPAERPWKPTAHSKNAIVRWAIAPTTGRRSSLAI